MIDAIVVVLALLIYSLITVYFPAGWLGIVLCTISYLIVFYAMLSFLAKRREEKNKAKNFFNPSCFFSGEAVDLKINIGGEFDKRVSAIAIHQAKLDGKEFVSDGHSEIPKEILISPEDIEAAFFRAMKEISEKCEACSSGCGNARDKESFLEKIRNLRKKYEKQTP